MLEQLRRGGPLRVTIRDRVPLARHAWALLRHLRGRKARFTADYRENSGAGADAVATRAIITALPALLTELGVRRMLDVPCGDFVWMREIDLGAIQYIGADLIDDLIAAHRQRYASPTRTFMALDLVTDRLPDADLIFCRGCLVHFSHRMVKRAVNNIRRSNARYLLASTFPAHPTNRRIVTGDWWPLNLCAPPFNFPRPLRLLFEDHPAPFTDKALGLWRVADLPTY